MAGSWAGLRARRGALGEAVDTQRLRSSARSLRARISRRRLVGGTLATIFAGRSTAPDSKAEPGFTGSGSVPRPGVPAEAAAATRPNIILIVMDDMRADDLAFMPAVQELLVAQGTNFTNFFTTAPGCAPSRASILRGQYPHNHGVLRSDGILGGFERFYALGHEQSTLPVWLQDAGYRTALIGKYLNGYPYDGAPQG